MKSRKLNNKGISLISLIVTVIIIVVLASITVSTLIGDNGIITGAANTQNIIISGEQSDKDVLEEFDNYISNAIDPNNIPGGSGSGGSENPGVHQHVWSKTGQNSATCTQAGVEYYVCSCGQTMEKTIPAKGHSWGQENVTKVATCVQKGEVTKVCSVCSETTTETTPINPNNHTGTTSTNYVKLNETVHTVQTICNSCNGVKSSVAENHTWNSGTVTIPATCTTSGSKTLTCTACGQTKTETTPIDSNNHTGTTRTNYAKLNDTVHTVQTICNSCNGVKYSTTASHAWNNGAVTTVATCTTSGIKTYTCTECTQTKQGLISALGHSYSTTVQTSPTCTSSGTNKKTCTRTGCGYSYTYQTAALGHLYTETKGYQYLKSYGDCLNEPVYYKSCSRTGCDALSNETFEDTSECLEHTFNLDYNTSNVSGIEGDWEGCWHWDGDSTIGTEHNAYVSHYFRTYCTKCWRRYYAAICWDESTNTGCEFDSSKISLHDFTGRVVDDKYLCDSMHEYWYSCTTCGASYGDNMFDEEWVCFIDESSCVHDWTLSSVTTAATCTTNGYGYYTCSNCSAQEYRAIPALGHNYKTDVETEENLLATSTCTLGAKYAEICSRCNALGTKTWYSTSTDEYAHLYEMGGPKGHIYDFTYIAPTCEEEGYLKYVCGRCGDTYTEVTSEATGHDLYIREYDTSVTDENCYWWAECANCGLEEFVEGSHAYGQIKYGNYNYEYTGVCDNCGHECKHSNGYKFINNGVYSCEYCLVPKP